MTSRRTHLSYANVVATLALVVAVAGIPSAVAITSKLKKNSVGTKQLKKGSVTADKLAWGAVTAPKLADGSVTGPNLADTHVAVDTRGPDTIATAGCAGGEALLSGGGFAGTLGKLVSSQPVVPPSNPGAPPAGWEVVGTGGTESTAYAVCLKQSPSP
jgi:hypothetical protein